MNTIELEVEKASLVREILAETDEKMIKKLWILLKNNKLNSKDRQIGAWEGKVFFTEEGNGKISIEEFLGS